MDVLRQQIRTSDIALATLWLAISPQKSPMAARSKSCVTLTPNSSQGKRPEQEENFLLPCETLRNRDPAARTQTVECVDPRVVQAPWANTELCAACTASCIYSWMCCFTERPSEQPASLEVCKHSKIKKTEKARRRGVWWTRRVLSRKKTNTAGQSELDRPWATAAALPQEPLFTASTHCYTGCRVLSLNQRVPGQTATSLKSRPSPKSRPTGPMWSQRPTNPKSNPKLRYTSPKSKRTHTKSKSHIKISKSQVKSNRYHVKSRPNPKSRPACLESRPKSRALGPMWSPRPACNKSSASQVNTSRVETKKSQV